MAGGHHVESGQTQQIFTDFNVSIHQIQQGAQGVKEVMISVPVSSVKENVCMSLMKSEHKGQQCVCEREQGR